MSSSKPSTDPSAFQYDFLGVLQNNWTTNSAEKSHTVNGEEADLTADLAHASSTGNKEEGEGLTDTEGDQKQQFFDNLLDALGPRSGEDDAAQGTFAVCKTVKYSQGFILKSFQVEGAGELQLPLSEEDVPKLRRVSEQAPFGKGLATLVDTSVRRCWQVDASKLSFPGTPNFLSDTTQSLAEKAVRELGFDGEGVQLEAHLYKLLLYEEGGHFTFHRDTEKEKGMFATMILQLPTEEGYSGGKLVVKHSSNGTKFEEKEFDCHMVSTLGFCYAIFFADCLHELRKIEFGTRLCLAFNLVKRDSSLDPVHREFILGKAQKVEAALQPWLQCATEGKSRVFGAKIAIPLQHKYTEENLSFAWLKGDDSILAEVLKECRDQNKEKWLELYLCLVTKYQIGKPSRYRYVQNYRRTFCDSSDSDCDYQGVKHPSIDDPTETIEFKKWIGEDDHSPSMLFKDLCIDLEEGVVLGEGMGPFDSKPNNVEYEGYLGNSGPTLEHWYHTAMLVAWPRLLSISVACESGFSGALDFLENSVEISSGQVHQVVSFCEANIVQVWGAERGSKTDSVTPRLLRLCKRASALEVVLQILKFLAKAFQYDDGDCKDQTFDIGVRNGEVADAIATAVEEFGWDSVSTHVIDLTRQCALAQCESFAHLAKQLIPMGNTVAGALVAKTAFEVLRTRIADLASHKEPIFTWYQPHAKFPNFPEVESFLKGPQEKYEVGGFNGIDGARSFAKIYFQQRDCTVDGYSAIATPAGKGRGAFCEIQKTRDVFYKAHNKWRKEQEEIKRLRLELGNLMSAVPETYEAPVTTPPNVQHDKKRQKLDAQVLENAESSRQPSMSLNFLDLNLGMWANGM